MKKQYLEAGQIVNTHGIRGEVKIKPWADNAAFLKDFETIFIEEKPVHILHSRVHKDCLIVALEGVEDVTAAARLKNKIVYINRDDAVLPEGSYFIQDLLGAKVIDEKGTVLGQLDDVLELPASNVYVVKGEREILIPAVPAFVLHTDVEHCIITVRLIEGM